MDDRQVSDLLRRLEQGQVGVDDVLEALEGDQPAPPPSRDHSMTVSSAERWWWLALAIPALAMMLLGAWLVSLQGWWLLPAILLLLAGGLLFAVGVMSANSPWIRLRVNASRSSAGRSIVVHLPLPLRSVGWLARLLGKNSSILEDTALDELIDALAQEGRSGPTLGIDVERSDGGERIRVSFD